MNELKRSRNFFDLFSLPIELSCKIVFDFLEFNDYRTLDLVTKRFRKELTIKLTRLILPDVVGINVMNYVIKVYPSIEVLLYNLTGRDAKFSIAMLIAYFSRYEKIKVFDMTTASVHHLQLRPNSETIPFTWQQRWQCTNLYYLGLHGCQVVNDDHIDYFCDLNQLQILDIGDCINLTDRSLAKIAENQVYLEHLDIGSADAYSMQYSVNGFLSISRCTNMKSFIARNNIPIQDAFGTALEYVLSSFQHLELLDISVDDPIDPQKRVEFYRELSIDVLDRILDLPCLRILHLGGIATGRTEFGTSRKNYRFFNHISLNCSGQLRWVGLQQTTVLGIEVIDTLEDPDYPRQLLEDPHFSLGTHHILRGTVMYINHWADHMVTSPFRVFHYTKGNVDLHICHGSHNVSRSKDKRWLQWPMIPNEEKKITLDY